ncbi:MAG: hypothetical protein HFI33_07385 [Lachnospiraceae bacterium]|nr:hypothetical protein [Lachnospiraceae bacterium]
MKRAYKESKGTHDYLGALAQKLGNCHPYSVSSGILVGEKNWVSSTVEASIGNRRHPVIGA